MNEWLLQTPSPLRTVQGLWVRYHGPTWVVLGVVYGGWLGLTMAGGDWPAWLIVLVGGPLLCLHGSLQHELIHGHLLGSARANDRLASAPLSLWLPYSLYRDSHRRHHATGELTHPTEDPESFYVAPERWQQLGPLHRALLVFNNTLVGRLLVGPLLMCAATWVEEWRQIRMGTGNRRSLWVRHALGVMVVLAWLAFWDFPWHRYVLLVVWPGTSLVLLRSYYEHRPAAQRCAASVVVEAALPWRLLFLNNNYHVLHHSRPQLPWYRLHDYYLGHREQLLAANQGFFFGGYGAWFWRFGWRVKDHPEYPIGMNAAEAPGRSEERQWSEIHERIASTGDPGGHRCTESRAGGRYQYHPGGIECRATDPASR